MQEVSDTPGRENDNPMSLPASDAPVTSRSYTVETEPASAARDPLLQVSEPTRSGNSDSVLSEKGCQTPFPVWHHLAVEFLNFLLIFAAGYLVLRRPDRERLAFRLLVASSVLMASLFLIGARGSILPGLNF